MNNRAFSSLDLETGARLFSGFGRLFVLPLKQATEPWEGDVKNMAQNASDIIPAEHPVKRWYRLDNAANLYPAVQSNRVTTVYRFSMTLTQAVDPVRLQESMAALMPRFPYLHVRLRRGFFWYYLEQNNLQPRPQKDVRYPNGRLHPRLGTRHMFRVRYWQNRIAVEFSHVLTDGTGALAYLKALVYDYLRRVGVDPGDPGDIPIAGQESHPQEAEDGYRRFYRKPLPLPDKGRITFHPVGRMLRPDVYLVTTGISPMAPAMAEAKRRGVTLTMLLSAIYIDVLQEAQDALGLPDRRKKPISLSIPVNLRTIFSSRSLRNFTLYVSPEIDPRLGAYSFEEILQIVQHFMAAQVNEKSLSRMISRNVGGQRNPVVRVVPLFLKRLFFPLLYTRMGECLHSGTLSNIGRVVLPPEMTALVERVEFIPSPNPVNRTNLSMVGYDGNLYMNFGRVIRETDTEMGFFRRLVKMGIPVRIETN